MRSGHFHLQDPTDGVRWLPRGENVVVVNHAYGVGPVLEIAGSAPGVKAGGPTELPVYNFFPRLGVVE